MMHHRWIVAIGTYVTELIATGLLYAFPVLFSALLEMFRNSRAKTAAVGSVLFGVLGCAGVIAGLLVQRFGPRKAGFLAGLMNGIGWMVCFFSTSIMYLVLLLSVPMAIGCSLIVLSVNKTLCHHFPGKPGQIALSIQATASGVGRIMFTYVLIDCVNTFGLRGTFLIMGAVLLNCSIISILWNTELPSPPKTPQRVCKDPNDTHGMTKTPNFFIKLCPVLTNKIFLIFVIGMTLLFVPHGGFMVMFADIMKSRGFTEENIQLAIIIHSISNVVGGMSLGFLKQIPRISSLFLVFLLACISAISFSTLQFAEQFWTTVIACSVLGFEMGATATATTIGTLKIIGIEYFPFGLGVVYTSMGIGNVIVGPISGTIRDVTGTYTIFMWTSTLSSGVSAILILVAMIMKHYKGSKKDTVAIAVDVYTITKF
ncbi:hypothetical protein ACJMK2_004295 [Sinanodonta woodiana]|uniref:Major facilitator superfamily (MFS) profile domain-containing protein n=1 Tax=Sinanodonta woodiana TaxID=1069815 RepID=A0ABD3Y0Q5_SINWO